jgi:hypothetical protein
VTAVRKISLFDEEWNFHAVRAALYRAMARLLDPGAEVFDLARLRAELGALHCPARLLPAHDELSTALKGSDAAKLAVARTRWASGHAPLAQTCDRGYGSAGPRACVIAELQVTINPLAELRVLARLATKTADALREGNESLAREYRSLQRQLLSQHSGLCLETLGAHLAADGGPVFAGVGRALERLIETDVMRIQVR